MNAGGSGGLAALGTDPESLERGNDVEITRMGEKVDFLKNITRGIHEEVDRQNRNLDFTDISFGTARAQISGTVERFSRIMGRKAAARPLLTIGVIVVALFILYYSFV